MLLTEESTLAETETGQQPEPQPDWQTDPQTNSQPDPQPAPQPDQQLAAALTDPFRLHTESLITAFSYMTIGVLTGGYNLLTRLNDMEVLESDGLQRGIAGTVAVMIVLIAWWQSGRSWEYRQRISGLSFRYLAILAAGALFSALFTAGLIYHSREFQNWSESYALVYAWSYYGQTTDSLKTVICGTFLTSLASVFFFSFVANYFLPKLNIRAMGVRLPERKRNNYQNDETA